MFLLYFFFRIMEWNRMQRLTSAMIPPVTLAVTQSRKWYILLPILQTTQQCTAHLDGHGTLIFMEWESSKFITPADKKLTIRMFLGHWCQRITDITSKVLHLNYMFVKFECYTLNHSASTTVIDFGPKFWVTAPYIQPKTCLWLNITHQAKDVGFELWRVTPSK